MVIIRLPMVYGRGDRNFAKLLKLAKKGFWPAFLGRPTRTSFIHVEDVVKGLILVSDAPKAANKTYILTEEIFYNLKEIGDIISVALKKKLITVKVPKSLVLLAIFFQELLFRLINKKPFIVRSQIERWASQDWIYSGEKIKRELGFVATTSLAQGAKITISNQA